MAKGAFVKFLTKRPYTVLTRPHVNTWLILVAFTFIATSTVYGQGLAYHEPHTGRTVFVDREHPSKFSKSDTVPHLRVPPTGKGIGNLTFNFTFGDVTANNNEGFDHPIQGATRRATVAAVATYINETLNETSGAILDVQFEESELDGSGALAFAGTFWECDGENRYDNGFAYQHIITGGDPSEEYSDIIITFDFGYTWNSERGTPTSGEYDFSTLLLHEFTHGLGFAALTDENGHSGIEPFLNPGVFTDMTNGLTRTTDSFDLWTEDFTFVGVPADLASNNTAFAGSNATAANSGTMPRVYAPNPFGGGSSISHWDLASFPNEVMKPAFARGFQQLEYGLVDYGFLKDIGYTLDGPITFNCPDTGLIREQHAEVLAGIPLTLDETTDLDGNDIPDELEVALFLRVLCNFSIPFNETAQATYLANIARINSSIPLLSDTRKFAAVAAGISGDFIGATPLAPEAGTLSSVTISAKGGSVAEPFSAGGDVDLDGMTNLDEYNNAVSSGGDYVQVASDPFLDGTEGPNPIPVAGVVRIGMLLVGLGALGVASVRRKISGRRH